MKKKLLLILILFLAAASVATGLFARHMARYAQMPVNPSLDRSVELVIKPGQSFKDITAMLREKGLINHPTKFRILAVYQKATTRIKAGEYRIPGSMSPGRILRQLGEGRVHLHRVTLPEGLTIHETAQRVADAGLCEKSEFTRAATDPELARQMGLSAKTTEGYLFPETYYFEKPVSAETIVQTMVRRFQGVFSDQWKQRADELGLSVHEIVTLASIIEKETGAPEERKTVSSVFHNRLERGMRLDSDPTVIYGIEDFDGNLTRKHLRTPTAYNTYKRKGLPPGPIANPGQASLHAALYPADTPYLYFVADSENSHYFSTTLKEHNRAVRKYQLNR